MQHFVSFMGDAFSLTILLILLMSVKRQRHTRYTSTSMLGLCIMSVCISTAADMIWFVLEGSNGNDTLKLFFCDFPYICMFFVEALAAIYLNSYVNEHKPNESKIPWRFSNITISIEALCIFFTIILMHTGRFIIIQDGQVVLQDLFIIPSYLACMTSVILTIYLVLHRKYLTLRESLITLSLSVLTSIGYLFDTLFPSFSFSIIAATNALLLNCILVKEREIADVMEDEEKKAQLSLQHLLNISDRCEAIYSINLNTGSIKLEGSISGKNKLIPEGKHYYQLIGDTLATHIHDDDRHRILDFMHPENLIRMLDKSDTATCRFRKVQDGRSTWFKLRVKRDDGWPYQHKILMGLLNNDEEISRERQYEQELEKQLKRQKLIHETIGSASWSFPFNKDKVITAHHYSEELVYMFGFTPEEYNTETNEKHISRIHPDDRNEGLRKIYAAVKDPTGNTFFDAEHRMLHKDGTYHWYHSAARVLLNEDGSGELIGTHVNTDAVHEKEALQEQREQMYSIEQLRADMLSFITESDTDIDMFFSFLLNRILQKFNCDQVVFIGNKGLHFSASRSGEIIPAPTACDSCPLRPLRDGAGEVCFSSNKTGCNGLIPVPECKLKSLLSFSTGENGYYLAVQYLTDYHTFTDEERSLIRTLMNMLTLGLDRLLTKEKLKNNLEHFKLVHEIIHTGLWSCKVDPDDTMYDEVFPEECISVLGYDREHFAIDQNFFTECIIPSDRERCGKSLMATLRDKTGSTPFNEEFLLKDQNGDYHWIHGVGRCLRYENGFGEFFGMFINTDAEHRQLELQLELKAARDQAEAASAAKSLFLFNMSHDIRTPMNAIMGFTELAKMHSEDMDVRDDCLKKVRTSSEYLLMVLNDVLDMARIESGKLQLIENTVPFNDITTEILDMQILAAEEKGIQLHHMKENIIAQYVQADDVHIRQILINLLSNAVKYGKAGGDIWFSQTQAASSKEGYVTVTTQVRDNGIGMSREFLERVYGEFERERSTTESGIQGTGLGMAIVKKLTDLMGGKITIESEKDKGTCVTLILEHRISTKDEIDRYRNARNDLSEAGLQQAAELIKGKRGLLVEDNELNREISTIILQESGLVIETANDGSEAVRLIKEKGAGCYDFVLMDIQMPVMNGYEATREIRKFVDADRLPIIAFSANAFDEDRRACLEAGMNGHAAKPIDIKALIRTIASLV